MGSMPQLHEVKEHYAGFQVGDHQRGESGAEAYGISGSDDVAEYGGCDENEPATMQGGVEESRHCIHRSR